MDFSIPFSIKNSTIIVTTLTPLAKLLQKSIQYQSDYRAFLISDIMAALTPAQLLVQYEFLTDDEYKYVTKLNTQDSDPKLYHTARIVFATFQDDKTGSWILSFVLCQVLPESEEDELFENNTRFQISINEVKPEGSRNVQLWGSRHGLPLSRYMMFEPRHQIKVALGKIVYKFPQEGDKNAEGEVDESLNELKAFFKRDEPQLIPLDITVRKVYS